MIGDTASIPDVPQAPVPDASQPPAADTAQEFGGRPGLDPTRYGDWEKNGRCIDF
ncbi:DUF1674 domain-containing protein [Cognatiluteimonas profundi]|uniref:DUF1674 domain-containing protein n=1 Tax=Cognatiluteimonas profundi TaxID=2594501 RepID=UPI00131E7853|nr:DUF1674 domain-containing protein [Lysobacter profundi]